MGALELENLTWPEVRQEIEAGRDTIVVAFGAVEQHGHHLPLGTDAFFGDELSRTLAERLDAFRAPTVRVGCSRHHLAFPGTMSIEEETFHARRGRPRSRLVAARLPAHRAAADARRQLRAARRRARTARPLDGVKVIGISDLGLLVQATLGLGGELGVPASEGGIHGGEWETSMMLALRPELVKMDRAVPGYTGDLETGLERFSARACTSLSDTGVFGDPTKASAEHGRLYIERLLDLTAELVERESQPGDSL